MQPQRLFPARSITPSSRPQRPHPPSSRPQRPHPPSSRPQRADIAINFVIPTGGGVLCRRSGGTPAFRRCPCRCLFLAFAVACSCRHSAALLFSFRSPLVCHSVAQRRNLLPPLPLLESAEGALYTSLGHSPRKQALQSPRAESPPYPLLIAHSSRLAALKTASHPQNPQQNPLVKTLEPHNSP